MGTEPRPVEIRATLRDRPGTVARRVRLCWPGLPTAAAVVAELADRAAAARTADLTFTVESGPAWLAGLLDLAGLADTVPYVPTEDVLQDNPHRRVVRIGDTVRRPLQPWSPAVHALLRHLEAVGFDRAPRVLGVDPEGREILTWIEGESGPAGWAPAVDERGLVAMARLLRDYHAAVGDFRPDPALPWATNSRPLRPGEIVGHGDVGPWNVVWRDLAPVGLLDWDYAEPAVPLHDLAYLLEYTAPFRDDAECLRWLRYDRPPDRRRRLEIAATAYGLTSLDGLVDAVIAQQRTTLARMRALGDAGREPQRTWLAEGAAETAEAQIRWSEDNRQLFL